MIDVETMDGKKHNKVIMSDSGRLSEAEINQRKAYLETLKIAPAEKEENRLLIARAERVIEETLSYERQAIIEMLMRFKYIIENGTSLEIRQEYADFSKLLDSLE